MLILSVIDWYLLVTCRRNIPMIAKLIKMIDYHLIYYSNNQNKGGERGGVTS